MRTLYQSCPSLVCFADEPDPIVDPAGDPIVPPAGGRVFTQDELNKYASNERRKSETEAKKYKAELEKNQKSMEELIAQGNLNETDRQRVELALDDMKKQLQTKEQIAAQEKKKIEEDYKGKLTEAEHKAQTWEKRYREETLVRALKDAAVEGEAFNADQVVRELREFAVLVPLIDDGGKDTGKFKVMVDYSYVTTDGDAKIDRLPPTEAVQKMRDDHKSLNLFKSSVAAGLGGSNTGSVVIGANGKLTQTQIKKLSQEQYNKLRKENPAALGF